MKKSCLGIFFQHNLYISVQKCIICFKYFKCRIVEKKKKNILNRDEIIFQNSNKSFTNVIVDFTSRQNVFFFSIKIILI